MKKRERNKWEREKDKTCCFCFIFKKWENPLELWYEERNRRTEDFLKRLSKFDKKEKMKNDIKKEIEALQKQLKDLE